MKISISSYSFQYDISRHAETQFSVIKKAKELGADAIEFTDLIPTGGITQLEYAKQLRIEAKNQGVEISAYSVGGNFLTKDINEEVERLKAQVEVAAELGVKLMRHDIGYVFPREVRKNRGFADIVDVLADGCRRITEYAATKGIRTMIENHGFFCQDSERVELLVNRVAHDNFGLLVDIGNFLCADESPITAVSRTAPYAIYFHIKDFIFKSGQECCIGKGFIQTRGGNYIRGTVAGQGVVPVSQCVAILKKAGYDGYLSLEFEGPERLDYALSEGIGYIKRICESL